MELIEKYFGGELTPLQRERFARLYDLYAEWNARINVVSRKDFDSLYLKHVLHSLAIARVCRFDEGARVCDVGTGGGFPAVPLAVLFPCVRFTAADSIGKKIAVVRAVAAGLGLDNLEAVNVRAETLPGGYDYVVSRAVTELSVLKGWMWNKIVPGRKGTLPNGMLVLKGGDLAEELAAAGGRYEVFDIAQWFDEEFFATKKVVYQTR
jgi:16S rRNA (guanine527-N7)-methyltransferase